MNEKETRAFDVFCLRCKAQVAAPEVGYHVQSNRRHHNSDPVDDFYDVIEHVLVVCGRCESVFLLQLKHIEVPGEFSALQEERVLYPTSTQPPDLDSQVEAIELELRNLISEVLHGGDGNLPPHVLQRIQQRITAASKKNPALDANFYETLAGKLEYADLRELQDTVTNKENWHLFHQVFLSKEMRGCFRNS